MEENGNQYKSIITAEGNQRNSSIEVLRLICIIGISIMHT